MSSKVLAIYYTQSGQLAQIMDNFTAPFAAAGISVEKVTVTPRPDFGFPWTSETFFDAMPESVLGIPTALEPFHLQEKKYDLILFGYQPWYLAPSIPANSLLHNPEFRSVLADTPVVTIIGARNMWLNAQERMKKALRAAGANLVGNIALVDTNGNLISAVTILHWMLTGRKDRKWGIFPNPGVQATDIENAGSFGKTVLAHLQTGNWEALQPALIEQEAVTVNSNLMFIEQRAPKLFSIWANLIKKKKNRKRWLVIFKYYLLIALFIIAPIILAINSVLFRPFFGKSINKKKQYYLELN